MKNGFCTTILKKENCGLTLINIDLETQYSRKKKVLMCKSRDTELICTPNILSPKQNYFQTCLYLAKFLDIFSKTVLFVHLFLFETRDVDGNVVGCKYVGENEITFARYRLQAK